MNLDLLPTPTTTVESSPSSPTWDVGPYSGAPNDDDSANDHAGHTAADGVRCGHSPETAHVIDPAVREWSADTRPIGVGTRFTIRGSLGIVLIRGASQVVVWDPPTRSEFRSVAPIWPVRMTASHRFEERAGGGIEYTWSISFEEVSIVARPLVAILSRLFRRAFAAPPTRSSSI